MTTTHDLSITVLRASLGLVLLAHGLAKIFVYTVPGTIQFFESVGMPGAMAVPVILVEVIGGVLLLAGMFTRWAALAAVPIMLGATSVHWPNGWTFSNEGGGWEFTAFLAAVALALFLHGGDGRFSLSRALQSKTAR